jgi:hypothetical protein
MRAAAFFSAFVFMGNGREIEKGRERERENTRRDPLSTPLRRENICIVAALASRIHPPVIAVEIVIFFEKAAPPGVLSKARQVQPGGTPHPRIRVNFKRYYGMRNFYFIPADDRLKLIVFQNNATYVALCQK